MDGLTRSIRAYLIHDAVNNVEGYITDFDGDALRAASESGFIFIAEYNDGSREVVSVDDIVEPKPQLNGVELVQPPYVDERMAAVVGVFDALAETLAADGSAAISLASADEADNAPTAVQDFMAALAELKAIVYGGDGK